MTVWTWIITTSAFFIDISARKRNHTNFCTKLVCYRPLFNHVSVCGSKLYLFISSQNLSKVSFTEHINPTQIVELNWIENNNNLFPDFIFCRKETLARWRPMYSTNQKMLYINRAAPCRFHACALKCSRADLDDTIDWTRDLVSEERGCHSNREP